MTQEKPTHPLPPKHSPARPSVHPDRNGDASYRDPPFPAPQEDPDSPVRDPNKPEPIDEPGESIPGKREPLI